MDEWIEVRNFRKYQHYRDRNPPWIKLYGSLFHDCAFTELQDASKLLFIGLLILASRTENHIALNRKWITQQLSLTTRLDLAPLEQAGFIVIHQSADTLLASDASKNGAPCKHNVALSREEERRGREEAEVEKNPEVIRKLLLESLRSSTGKEAK